MDSNNNSEEITQKDLTEETAQPEETAGPEQTEKKSFFSKKPKEKKTPVREVFDWVEIIALSLAFVLLTFSYVARQARVDGSSMRETFHHGESIVISNLFYTPKQGDVIVFQVPNSLLTTEPIIKRVIAVGGQTVYIDFDNWKVYVYDDASLTVDQVLETVEPLDEPYIEAMRSRAENKYATMNGKNTYGGYSYPLTIEKGKLFCMGDNRNGSTDSRWTILGPVDERYILGKVLFRIYPLAFSF
ncbi:MAG: signal peptidase I [Clostridia bacterium]|nr:signal peptidase I [Clostridia bacterium]